MKTWGEWKYKPTHLETQHSFGYERSGNGKVEPFSPTL